MTLDFAVALSVNLGTIKPGTRVSFMLQRGGEAGGGLEGNGRRVLRYTDLRRPLRGNDPRPATRELVFHRWLD
jgi:hypothetical protein